MGHGGPVCGSLMAARSSPGLQPHCKVIITARNHLFSASGKPSSCSLSDVNALFVTSSPRRAGGFESRKGINTPVRSLRPRRAPSGLEDVASKMVLPAVLNVNGSSYSHVPATTCPRVTYQAQSTPHLNVAHCWWSQARHSSSYLCEHSFSE